MTEEAKQGYRPEDDICECGHYRDEHHGGSGYCEASARPDAWEHCTCPSFELDPDA